MPNSKGTRKNRGEGSIRLRSDGLYEARVTLGYRDGKRIQKSVYGRTEEEVVAKKNKLLAERGLGALPLPERLTVEDMLLEWLEHKRVRVKPTSIVSYERVVNKLVTPRLGTVLVQKLEVDHLEGLYRDLKRSGYSSGSIRVVHNVLHDALERLRRRRKIAENPADLVDELPRDSVKFEPRLWTLEETRRFLEGIREHRLFALYWLALTGSFRRGELLALVWPAISLEESPELGRYVVVKVLRTRTVAGNNVYVLEPKTHRSKRPVALPYQAWEVLQAHRERMEAERRELAKKGYTPDDQGYVFLSPLHEPWHPSNFYNREWLPLLERLKLPKIRFHDLRHLSVTLDLASGGDLKTASQRAGHSSITITAGVYQHPDLAQHLEATSRLAQLLAHKPTPTGRPN